MGKNQDSGTNTEATQEKENYENFLNQLPKLCKEQKLSEEQTKQVTEFAKKQEPSFESYEKVTKLVFEKMQSNRDDKTGSESEIQKLVQSKDFGKFIKIQEVTGEIEEDTDISKLSDEQKRQIVADYHGWVNAGRPTPELTKEAKGKIEKINSVSRVKHLGNQYLTYICDGDEKSRGFEILKTYAKVKNSLGEEFTDKDRVEKEEERYTIKYTEKEARKLVERCKEECVSPALSIKMHGRTFTVHEEENFFGDFDKVIAKAMKGELI